MEAIVRALGSIVVLAWCFSAQAQAEDREAEVIDGGGNPAQAYEAQVDPLVDMMDPIVDGFSRRRRTTSRGLVALKLSEVLLAVTPWSPGRTRYAFENRVCRNAAMDECKAASSPTSQPAGCASMCRVFQNDCSGFGRWMIQKSLGAPTYKAFKDQMRRRNVQRRRIGREFPLAVDYYESFTEVFTPNVTWADKSKPSYPWHAVEKLSDATTGDFIVWRYKKYETLRTTGHVTVIFSEPHHLGKGRYRVLIADSALSAHSAADDTRHDGGCTNGECGVGSGSLFFDTGKDGKIRGYRWSSADGSLQTDADFAIGRFNPEDFYGKPELLPVLV